MDFYTEQDNARRNSKWLLLLFLAAVLVLIGITNVLVALLLFFVGAPGLPLFAPESMHYFFSGFSWQLFSTISIGVGATVFLVVLVKWAQLSAGGKAVAERLGGRQILPSSEDRAERRCLNVVEEMSLAAGLPVPPVYVLEQERGINAFAAGISPPDAVIGITRGSLDRFDRKQLQGVIGHEFSHILNGDMRLNIRLAALLKGITFIGDVGEVLVRGGRNRGRSYSSSKKMPGQVLVLGIALWVLGWLGGLAAGFIKAAISRQREYLADASAVQFTRDPDSVAGALKVIGGHIPGTTVVASNATELSHIFFGQIADSMWQLFSTHPPLPERIRRIEPGWDGEYIRLNREERYEGTAQDRARAEQLRHSQALASAAAIAGAVAGQAAAHAIYQAGADAIFPEVPPQPLQEIPEPLLEQARDPLGANALVHALMLSAEGATRGQQITLLQQGEVVGLGDTVATLVEELDRLAQGLRFPLLELCLPALKCMSSPQYRQFKSSLLQVARADSRINLYEWCLYQVVRHYLDPEYVQIKPSRPRYRKPVQVRQHARTVMSLLAWHGHFDQEDREQAYNNGMQELGLHDLPIRALEDCGVQVFAESVRQLADCYPLLKPRVLKAMARCTQTDGKLEPAERQLLMAIAAVMDCPLPVLAAGPRAPAWS